jgi:hypothetical protein
MTSPKTLALATAFGLFAPFLVTPTEAATFSKNSAITAVEKLMPSDGPKEYVIFNLAEKKSTPDQLVYTMKEAKENNVVLAICGPKLEPIREMLSNALANDRSTDLEGLWVLIVADSKDLNGFRELLKPRGIHVKCGVYK